MSIRLARRMQRIRPSATVSITAKALALKEQGRDIISLSVGEPDFDTPEHIKAAAVAAIEAGQTKYTPVDGSSALKAAVAEKFRRDNGLEFERDQILVSSGAKQSCYNACQALLETGDEAILPTPCWVTYPEIVRLTGAEPVLVQTTAEHRYVMTPEQLEASITAQTRLLIVNSPCNPTGAVYTGDDWCALGEVLREHPRIAIIADDIYEHIYWDSSPFVSFGAACPHLLDRTITVNGVSKAYAMSGWRVGFAAGPVDVIKPMTSVQSQSTTNACSISQAAAVAALSGDQRLLAKMSAKFKERHDFLYEAVQRLDGFEAARGRGAFYLFPKIERALAAKGIADDATFCERVLDATGVALVPGSAFGAPGHLRISFAASRATLGDAVDRIGQFLSES